MPSVKLFGFATVIVSFDGMGLPDDPELGKNATDLMVHDCQEAVGGKLLKSWYNPETKKLYMVWEDRRDALYVAFNFRGVFAVLGNYFE